MFIRKFYEADAPTVTYGTSITPFGQGPEEVVVEKTEEKQPDLPNEPAKVEVKVETPVTPSTLEVKDETKVGEPAKVEKIDTPSFNLDEEIKKVDKYELFKKVGLSDFEIEALKYYESTGNLADYAAVKNVDFTKMTDTDIMRYNLRNQYKDLSNEEFELLAEDEITEKYKLNNELHDEKDVQKGKLRLRLDADKARKENIENQAKFKAPERQGDPNAAQAQQQMELQKQQLEQFKESVRNNDVTKNLLKDKRLSFGDKETAFNYEVSDASQAVDAAINPNKFFELMLDTKGQPDFNKVYKAYAILSDIDKYHNEAVAHGKALGKKEAFAELPGQSGEQGKPAKGQKPYANAAEALAAASRN